jgi:ubiquinone/menaquinone biosynthesis C-methylase UbiE
MAAARKSSPESSVTASFYRRIAKEGWRGSDYFTYSSSSPTFRRWLEAEIGLEKPARILSIGCGGGEFERGLAKAGHQVFGLDLSHAMLKRALRGGMMQPIEADARFLPFASNCCDTVLFPESIGHLALDEAFGEAFRVLKKRGRVLVTTYASHLQVQKNYSKYSFEHMVPALEEAGFRVRDHRYIKASRNNVADAPSDARATLLYIAASK